MRGAHPASGEKIALHGITPAYAGRTIKGGKRKWIRWDHPRVCGAHDDLAAIFTGRPGSPPRMRGALLTSSKFSLGFGITPAYAGRTTALAKPCISSWDHPRVCGAHRCYFIDKYIKSGSPPRMRGALSLFYFRMIILGITPAYAGRTTH